MIDVVAALIEENNRFLICRRPFGKSRGLLWEFPGGKTEVNESASEALIRECKEELDIIISTDDVVAETEYAYPDIRIRLSLIRSHIISGVPRALEHDRICWVTADELENYEFCPADMAFIRLLSNDKIE